MRYFKMSLVLMLLICVLSASGCSGQEPVVTPTVPTVQPSPTPTPIEIVIYGDFQCSTCERLHSMVEGELQRLYVDTGKARMHIRMLATVGPESLLAAEAALCAADQGKFYEYRDAIFAAWREGGSAAYSAEELIRIAGELELNQEVFRECLESGAKQAEVQANKEDALAAGVNDVPAVVIDGTIILANKPLTTYVDLIEDLLGK